MAETAKEMANRIWAAGGRLEDLYAAFDLLCELAIMATCSADGSANYGPYCGITRKTPDSAVYVCPTCRIKNQLRIMGVLK